MQWEKLFVCFLIWITSIFISCVPLFLDFWVGLKPELDTTFCNLASTLLEYMFMDINFLFVNITSLFVVWIEGYFTVGVLSKKIRIIQHISCICSIDFLFLYMCLFFKKDVYNLLVNKSKISLNAVFFVLSSLLVILNNYLISMEQDS